jgi:membrane-bound metal-dependent hydrolase YbcI (DUF457 family)
MYAGHFAVGLAMKSQAPRVPTWILLVGVGFVDLLFGVFVLAGIEHVTVTPGQSPGFHLDFIDWSHSLVASAGWAVLFALIFIRRGREVMFWAGAAVFSHFVLDYPMHPGDLALYPHAEQHVGLGLWQRWPTGWWWFELGFIACCTALYVVRARKDDRFGGRPFVVCAVVLALHLTNSPWLSPQ